jgi:hypothetical protein
VVQDEGLRSYKAIAFISSKAYMRLNAKTYSELRMFPQRKTAIFPKNIKSRVATALDVTLMKKLGDKKWKK